MFCPYKYCSSVWRDRYWKLCVLRLHQPCKYYDSIQRDVHLHFCILWVYRIDGYNDSRGSN